MLGVIPVSCVQQPRQTSPGVGHIQGVQAGRARLRDGPHRGRGRGGGGRPDSDLPGVQQGGGRAREHRVPDHLPRHSACSGHANLFCQTGFRHS